ncbi:hypothetical protein ADK76_11275 [Streptomyces griseoflavus]|nr:hypothetical protein ADK76_11275 [Streptomyces griseoflavus]
MTSAATVRRAGTTRAGNPRRRGDRDGGLGVRRDRVMAMTLETRDGPGNAVFHRVDLKTSAPRFGTQQP